MDQPVALVVRPPAGAQGSPDRVLLIWLEPVCWRVMASQFSIRVCASSLPATIAPYRPPISAQNAIRRAISMTAARSTTCPSA